MKDSRRVKIVSSRPSNDNKPAWIARVEALAATPWIEAGIAIVIGFVFFAFGKPEIAAMTWIIGSALSFTRYSFGLKLEEQLKPVRQLAAIVDLERDIPLKQLEEIVRTYLAITETEFAQVKDRVLSEAFERLRKLHQQKSSDVLQTGDYYNWLLPFIESAPKGSQIWAVSMMLSIEWDESPPEVSFLRLNLDAAQRGVYLERIFVVRNEDIPKLSTISPIRAQAENVGEFLKLWLVRREQLEKSDPQLLRELGDGLIAFDMRVAMIDFASPEGIRGYVTMNPGEIQKLRRSFENLRVHGLPLTQALLFAPTSN